MEIIYRAFQADGVLPEGDFVSEEECLQYELDKNTQRFKKEIVGIGYDNEIINIENGLDAFFENSIVVLIRTQEAADFIAKQGDSLDGYVDEVGAWYWDSDRGNFVPLEDKKREIINNLARLSFFSELLENV